MAEPLSRPGAIGYGALAGAAVFTALFATWLKSNMASIQANVAPSGATIAEEAIKSYLANRVGLTTERLQQIRHTVSTVQRMTGGGS